MSSLKIRKIDVLKVYPTETGTYFGRKWALVAYELSNDVKGIIDLPIPKDCDDIHPVAIGAIRGAINRGIFDNILRPVSVPAVA